MRFDLALEDIDKAFAKLDMMDKAVQKGVVSGLNKLAAQGLTQGVRAITQQYNIKTGDAKKGVSVTKASVAAIRLNGSTHATIHASGRSFPLFKFGARPTAPISQRGIERHGHAKTAKQASSMRQYPGRKRTTVKVKRAGARTRLEHAFVARMASGHVGVFERTTKRTLPIKEMHSIGVSGMFKAASIRTIKQLVRTKGPAVIRHEIGYQLSRSGNR
mgnify:CR=1 FL=1